MMIRGAFAVTVSNEKRNGLRRPSATIVASTGVAAAGSAVDPQDLPEQAVRVLGGVVGVAAAAAVAGPA